MGTWTKMQIVDLAEFELVQAVLPNLVELVENSDYTVP